jgi:hypothetical protein
MSIYGWFGCMDCKVILCLGKVLHHDYQPIYYHLITEEGTKNSQQGQLNRVIWKMLADHARHNLRVVIEGDPEHDEVLDTSIEIGGEEINDMSFDEYLKDWPG